MDGYTALHFASFHGNIKLIRFLIDLDGKIDMKNRQGTNMLHVAAQGD